MQSVTLHPDLMPAFWYALRAVKIVTKGAMQASELRLGGGTALAALWKHRHSTDLDFVANRDVFQRVYNDETRLRMRDLLRRERDERGMPVSSIATTRHMFGFKYDGVPVSIVRSFLENTADVYSNHTIQDSGVRLAKPEFILQGKIVGRLLKSRNPTDRDGYDMAFALDSYPTVFNGVLSVLEADDRQIFLQAVREATGIRGRGRPIVNPSHPEIAADPWGKAWQYLRRVLEPENSTGPSRDPSSS